MDNIRSMKSSKYNMFVEEHDNVLVFNSLSKETIRVDASKKDRIVDALRLNKIDKITDLEIDLLHRHGMIVNQVTEEDALAIYQYNKIVYNTSDLHLVVIPTMDCNFKCVYCPQRHSETKMSDDIANAIIMYVKRHAKQYKRVFIDWFGGEPMLQKETVKHIMKSVKNICKENRVILISALTTNGYELDVDSFNDFVNNGILHYQVSVDGDESTHNASRPHASNPDSFKKIISNLLAIKEHATKRYFNIGIRINVSPQNYDQIDSMIEYYQANFLDDHRFQMLWHWVRDWGGVDDNKEKRQLYKSSSDICRSFYQMCLDRGLKSVDYMSCKTGMSICEASKANAFVINYDGKIYKCAMLLDDPKVGDNNYIGQLNYDGKMQLSESKIARWLVSTVEHSECKDCLHYPMCMGCSCPYVSNFKDEISCISDRDISDLHIRNIALIKTIPQL